MSEVESLQPWQIFCSMFAIFWLFSAWCDQVLITLLLCIVFGVLSDVITKSMYSGPALEEKSQPQASAEEKKESNERIWREAEAELEDEEDEGVPPPLPAKDYSATTAQNINSLADKLQALVDRDEDTEEQQEEQQEEDIQPPRQYNRTVSDEYNQNTSAVNYNNREGVIQEEGLGQETINDDDDDDDDDDDNSEEDGKIYAKDSSDEEDYDYASREVNFNESESATEEEDEVNDDGDEREQTKKTVNNAQVNLKEDK